MGKIQMPHSQEAIWRQFTTPEHMESTALLQDNQRALEDWAAEVGGSAIPPATVTVAAVNALHPEAADFTCDGVSDELTIMAALAALPVAPNGSGRVLLSEGTFTLSDPIRVANAAVTIEGVGRATIINKTGQNNVTDTILGAAITVHNIQFVLKNLTMGTVAGGTGGTKFNLLFTIGPAAGLVTGCYFLGNADGGIAVQAGTSTGLLIAGNYFETAAGAIVSSEPDVVVVNNVFNGAGNLQFTAPGTGCVIANNRIILANAAYAIVVNNVTGILIAGNFISNTAGAIDIQRSRKCLIQGNVVRGVVNGAAVRLVGGTTVPCDDNAIVGNTIYGGTFGAGTAIVLVDGGAGVADNLVTANKCVANAGWGVDIQNAGCVTNVVVGNDLRGNTTGALADAGTGTIVLYPAGANGDNFP